MNCGGENPSVLLKHMRFLHKLTVAHGYPTIGHAHLQYHDHAFFLMTSVLMHGSKQVQEPNCGRLEWRKYVDGVCARMRAHPHVQVGKGEVMLLHPRI